MALNNDLKKKGMIDVRSGMLFPWHFLFMAAVVLVAALMFLPEQPIVSIVLIGASGFVLSGYAGTEINKNRRSFREYRSFYFMKSGSEIPFRSIEKLYINTSRTSQKVHTAFTNHSALFSDLEYNAWMKLDDGRAVHLFSGKNKGKLVAGLRKVSSFLNVPMEDSTGVH